MRIEHPQAAREDVPLPAAVTLADGSTRELDSDGCVDMDDADAARETARAWAEVYGVDVDAVVSREVAVDEDAHDAWIDPSEHTIDELESALAEIDSAAVVMDVKEWEQDGQGRKGAFEAIHNRLGELDEQREE
jgi:hypothetical protein